jgi:hypothetical protein
MNRRAIWVIGAIAVSGLATPGRAQETVNGGMVLLGPIKSNGPQAVVDFTTAGSTAPVKSGTLAARPGTCTVGQMYFATDAAAGQNLAYCTSSGWSQVASAGSLSGGVNSQLGTSYTLQDPDCTKLVTFSNASAVAVSLPRAGASGWFASGWTVDLQNRGAGTVTITPVTSTIDGAASLTIPQSAGVRIVSDGANYYTERGMGVAGAVSSPYSSLHSGGSTYTNPLPCFKVATVSYTELTAAATAQQINLVGSVTEPWAPTMFQVEETTPFASGSGTVTTLGVSVGANSIVDYYLPLSALMQSAGTINSAVEPGASLAANGAHSIFARISVTNANPGNLGNGSTSNLTSGALTIRACGVSLQ